MYVLSFDGQSHLATSRGARAIVAAFQTHGIDVKVTAICDDDADMCNACENLMSLLPNTNTHHDISEGLS